MSVSIGTLCQFLLGTFLPWRQVSLVNCSIPVMCLLLLSIIPESPLWLLFRNRDEEAKRSLAWLRGWSSLESVTDEFDDLLSKVQECVPKDLDQPRKILDKFKFLGKREVYWPLFLVSYAYFLSHFNGTTSFITYSVLIFDALKAPINEYHATVIMGSVQALGCAISVLIVHILGRRKLNFISVIGSGVCYMCIAIYIYFNGIFDLKQDESAAYDGTKHWVPTSVLILATFIFAVGIRILPWVLMGELFPNEHRASAAGLSAAIGYVQGFVPNKIFLSLASSITLPGVFLFYSILGFLGVCGLYFLLPETEGKSLADITDHFRGVKSLGNNVKRKKSQANQP